MFNKWYGNVVIGNNAFLNHIILVSLDWTTVALTVPLAGNLCVYHTVIV